MFSLCFFHVIFNKNIYLSFIIKFILLTGTLFSIIFFIGKANAKFSLLFSTVFSSVITILFYAFFYAANFFINYEKYYGVLSPIFLVFLALHLFINLVSLAYICAEEFTKIPNIKFIKR